MGSTIVKKHRWHNKQPVTDKGRVRKLFHSKRRITGMHGGRVTTLLIPLMMTNSKTVLCRWFLGECRFGTKTTFSSKKHY